MPCLTVCCHMLLLYMSFIFLYTSVCADKQGRKKTSPVGVLQWGGGGGGGLLRCDPTPLKQALKDHILKLLANKKT